MRHVNFLLLQINYLVLLLAIAAGKEMSMWSLNFNFFYIGVLFLCNLIDWILSKD